MSGADHILFLKNLCLEDKIVRPLTGSRNFKRFVKRAVAKVGSEQK